MVVSPVTGFVVAFGLMIALYWIFRNSIRKILARRFRRVQVLSAGYMAFAHGSNDAHKTMGIITLALVAAGVLDEPTIPKWVIVVAATAIALGTAAGGWRMMRTMGQRVTELEPVHGFAAETTAASVIYGASLLGIPLSTTHVISSSIMGVGTSKGPRGVRWGVARNLLIAWGADNPVRRVHRSGVVVRHPCHHQPITDRRSPDDVPPATQGRALLRAVHRRRGDAPGSGPTPRRHGQRLRPPRRADRGDPGP